MRCVAGAGLLMLVGCNQVFGIHKTEPFDAGVDVIADRPYSIKLTWQIADVLPSGDPDPNIVDAPIDPAPKVRYALPGQPLQDTTYSPSDGAVTVARELFTPQPDGGLATWRLEYTLAGEAPHEIQWAPADKHGQLTVPLFGRTMRNPVPIGSGYTFTLKPDSTLTSFSDPRIFTTGQWSEGLVLSYPGTGTAIDYDFANAALMSGSNARPEPALGDHAFLIDYSTDNLGCRFANGSAELGSAALQPSKKTGTTAVWDGSTVAVTSETVALATLSRLLAALGPLHGGTVSGTISLGIAANIKMPPLTGVAPSAVLPVPTALPAPVNPHLGATDLPAPVMITVLQCPFDANPLPAATQPAALNPFSRLLNVQLVSKRDVLKVTLASGMETAIASPTSVNFKLTFPAPIPTKITLTTPTSSAIALDGADEQVDIGPAGRPLILRFVPDTDPVADYYDVTLYQLDAGALVAKRIYTATAPQVEIDGSILAAGATYVFQLRSFKGHPDAQTGDFRAVSFPYGSAIIFTRTFHAT